MFIYTGYFFFLSRQNDECLETRMCRWNFVYLHVFFSLSQTPHFYVVCKSNQNGSFGLKGMKGTKIPFQIVYTNIQYPDVDSFACAEIHIKLLTAMSTKCLMWFTCSLSSFLCGYCSFVVQIAWKINRIYCIYFVHKTLCCTVLCTKRDGAKLL